MAASSPEGASMRRVMKKSLKTAIVQQGPEYLHLEKSLDKALRIIGTAAEEDAQLVVFGETWLTGYPAWLDRYPGAALWDHPPVKAVYKRMVRNSIAIPGPETEILAEAARKNGQVIVMGVNERIESGPGNGTIFNSLIIIGCDGGLLLHHRKLMPTYNEKLVYGTGDAFGLHSVDTPWGRLSALICWEHFMPMARQALHDSGETVHVALWPSVHEVHQLASRHYAFEGRCFVIAAGQVMKASELPVELPIDSKARGETEGMILNGGSAVIGPDGRYLMEPRFNTEEILYFTIEDLDRIIEERLTLDVSGHYSRPDIFHLSIQKKRL